MSARILRVRCLRAGPIPVQVQLQVRELMPLRPNSSNAETESSSNPDSGADQDLSPADLMHRLDVIHGPFALDYAYLLERAAVVFARQGGVRYVIVVAPLLFFVIPLCSLSPSLKPFLGCACACAWAGAWLAGWLFTSTSRFALFALRSEICN